MIWTSLVGSNSKESVCNAGDPGSTPGLGRSPGEGNDLPLQYSCLENPHGQRSLTGYSPWDRKESDMSEWISTHMIRTEMTGFVSKFSRTLLQAKTLVFIYIQYVGPLMDRNLVVQSRRWERERRKEANIPWVMQPASMFQGISQK